MTIITKAALAAELGITKARVSQYVQKGLPVRADGKLDREQALNWVNRTQVSQTFEDKGANRARRLAREGQERSSVRSSAAVRYREDEIEPIHVASRMAVLYALRPSAQIVAAAVLEAGGSLNVAYAAAALARGPFLDAAALSLELMMHPHYADGGGDRDLHVPRGWPNDPDWAAFAETAGVPYDPAALKAHLNATAIWSAIGDEDVRRFERDLTLNDVKGV